MSNGLILPYSYYCFASYQIHQKDTPPKRGTCSKTNNCLREAFKKILLINCLHQNWEQFYHTRFFVRLRFAGPVRWE